MISVIAKRFLLGGPVIVLLSSLAGPVSAGDGTSALVPRTSAALAAIAAALVLMAVFSVHKGALRDGVLAQMRARERSFSLSRCQMAFWFLMVFAGWLFLWLATGSYNTMTEQAVTLMGISAGTGLASVAIDRTKDVGLQDADSKLRQMGLVTSADVDNLVVSRRVV